MADRNSQRRASSDKPARSAANDDISSAESRQDNLPHAGAPANDNASINDLPACLEVTDEEVRLLHRLLGRQILALFG